MNKQYQVRLIISVFLVSLGSIAHATLINSAGDSSLSGATVIDFEGQTIGNYSALTIGNVTFSNAGTGDLKIANYTEGGIYGTSGLELSTQYASGSFNIDFATEVSAFGMIWGAADQSWTMQIYNNSNTLLDTLAIVAQTSPYIGYIGASGSQISHVKLVSGTSDWVKIDDFSFVAVPEPATVGLMGVLSIGTLFIRRRFCI